MAEPTEGQKLIYFQLDRMPQQKYETDLQNLGNVVLSQTLKDPALQLSDDQLSVRGCQGYRTVLSTHGIEQGTYYYEVTLHRHDETSQMRVGFATQNCHLDGPVGFDADSIALRTVDCSVCTQRLRLKEPTPDFDVSVYASTRVRDSAIVGCLIHLPVGEPPFQLPDEMEVCYTRGAINVGRKQAQSDSEEAEAVPKPSGQNIVVEGSFIKFYVDGQLTAAFRNLHYQRYYPAISLYNFATARVNFGRLNTKIPNYPLEFYGLDFTLCQRSGKYKAYGLGSCKRDYVPCEVNKVTREFKEFIDQQGEESIGCQEVQVQEVENYGFQRYEASMGQIQEFRDLYMRRSARENAILSEKIISGEFSIGLFNQLAKIYRGFKREKKVKK